MATKASNSSLSAAKTSKQDEFYTQLADIERELWHYREHFKGKVVYLNCDDPRVSNFFHYFSYNFEELGLKKIIATCYKSQNIDLFSRNDAEHAVYLEYEGDRDGNRVPDPAEIGVKHLKGDGDFRSAEAIGLLKQADIVVTNPPFSLFREYVAQLIEYDKKFIIIGSRNAVTYKSIFPLIKNDKMWLGPGFQAGNAYFAIPESADYAAGVYDEKTGLVKFRNACWFTNLDIPKRHDDLILYKTYKPNDYPSYGNYDAIEVGKTAEIPMDYRGVMGVPITYLDKFNPDQFEILGITESWFGAASKIYPKQTQINANGQKSTVMQLNGGAAIKVDTPPVGKTYYEVDGGLFIKVYARILIRRKGVAE